MSSTIAINPRTAVASPPVYRVIHTMYRITAAAKNFMASGIGPTVLPD